MAGEGKKDLKIYLGVDYNYIFCMCVCVEVNKRKRFRHIFYLHRRETFFSSSSKCESFPFSECISEN